MRVSMLMRHCTRQSSSSATVNEGSKLIGVAPGISPNRSKRRAQTQGLGHQLVLIAPVGEIEAEEQVQRLAIQRADRQHVRGQLQHQFVLP